MMSIEIRQHPIHVTEKFHTRQYTRPWFSSFYVYSCPMSKELFDALRSVEVSETDAIAVVGAHEQRFHLLDNRLHGIELRMTALEGKVNLLSWMVGFNLTLTVAVLLALILKK